MEDIYRFKEFQRLPTKIKSKNIVYRVMLKEKKYLFLLPPQKIVGPRRFGDTTSYRLFM